jgi:hypothetical protein
MAERGDVLGVGSCFHCSTPLEFAEECVGGGCKWLCGKGLGVLLFFLAAGMTLEGVKRFWWGTVTGTVPVFLTTKTRKHEDAKAAAEE